MSSAPYDVEAVRKDFPVLSREVHGKPLVYLDSASSSHKPRQVLEAERQFVEEHYSNVHRGVHTLSQEATDAYESARTTVAEFIGGAHDEVVFTKNVTESINLVAYALSNPGSPVTLGPGDEVCVTEMEHHSNLVPWQQLCERTGATLRWFGLTDEGRLDLDTDPVNERTKVLAFGHVSNILGTENPVAELAARGRAVGALTVVDGAQAVPHQPVSVRDLGVDLYAFTGHKMLGPTGVGVLWGRTELLNALPAFMGGGSMIEKVSMTGSTFAKTPERFEAGTPVISQAIGLAAACDYLSEIGLAAVKAHEVALTGRLLDGLRALPGVRVIGPDTTELRGSAVSFVVDGVHPHDVGQSLDELGVAVRVGHHCAAPVCQRYGVPATARASSYLYNTEAEIDVLLEGIQQVQAFWGCSMSDTLYQEIILDHYRNPHHKGLRDPYDVEVHHVNPTCGDEVTVRVAVRDGVVADVSYEGQGCSISQASTSVMTDLVIGQPVESALEKHEAFLELMQSRGALEPDEDVLEDGIAFAGVSKYPARVKCALLGWMAWKDATAQAVAGGGH